MTTKIYRLADGRDVGKRVLFSDNIALKAPYNDALLLSIGTDGYRLNLDMGMRDTEIFLKKFAFVEVTLADFDSHALAKELTSRAIKGDNDAMDIMAGIYSYGNGYEAGKRDAEPRWIGVDERLPPLDERVLICALKYDDKEIMIASCTKPKEIWFERDNGRPDAYPETRVTHWMPLPKPPEQEKPESPKHACAQCAAPFSLGYETNGIETIYCSAACHMKATSEHVCVQCGRKINIAGIKFCSAQCAEDYEWVDAEFPRDYGKACRVSHGAKAWIYHIKVAGFLNIGEEFENWVTNQGRIEYRYCQVRRDSVGEK